MAETLEDEQEESAAATQVEHALGWRAVEVQILHPFAIQLQPRFDVRVFGVTCRGLRISLLDFVLAFPIDLRKHWPERHAENRALRPAPAAPVRKWFSKLEDLTGKFHSWRRQSCLRGGMTQVLRMRRLRHDSTISRSSPGPR